MKKSTSRKSIEIEIQVEVEKTKGLLAFLKKHAKFMGEERQIDRYFVPAHRDFTKQRPVNEWLRLRDSSGVYSINYKNWHRAKDGRSHYCDEYESRVESLVQLQNIFRALNVVPLVTVDKRRRIWRYRDYEITMDSVKGLKNSVEIEYKGAASKKKPAVITGEMLAFLKAQGCGRVFRNYVGYPYRLLFPKEFTIEEY